MRGEHVLTNFRPFADSFLTSFGRGCAGEGANRMVIHFPPFHADLTDERLWKGTQPIHLTRKAWAVLRALLEADGRLLTKEKLAATVWCGTYVGDDSLTKVVGELRRALADDQRAPRFIATVHGRGYRFIAPLRDRGVGSASQRKAASRSAALVGRERELTFLRSWLADALHGQRQVGFVSGEVGIGKSSLVSAFCGGLAQDQSSPARVAVGACVEQYGGAEPFLPVIAALRRLAGDESAATTLRQAAPPWLGVACGVVARTTTMDHGGLSRAGVLRTLAEVVEAMADAAPLVFVLEDLHWSDPSTLDLVNLLARRADPARLLILCTLRQADALAAGHASAQLLRELRRTNLCREIVLEGLAQPDVDQYLAARLAGGDPPAQASAYFLRHTGGNPFFLASLVDDLTARGSLSRTGRCWELQASGTPAIPSGSLAALAPRLERLGTAERSVLETASVIGDVFSAETVAAVIGTRHQVGALEEVEALCERLVRHQDVLRAGEAGTPYGFRHALYRQALYEGIAPARRRRIHGRVGELLAAARPAGSAEGAAELAEHFARAGDHAQASRYHAQAAEAARARFADREVAAHLSAALAHLRQSPRTPERDGCELLLVQQHAAAALAANGIGDNDAAADYRRAQALAQELGVPLAHFAASAGALFVHLMRAELNAASRLAGELTALAASLRRPRCAAAAQAAAGAVLVGRGDLIAARRYLEGLRGVFPRRDVNFPLDGAVWYLGILATLYADTGEADTARAVGAELLDCAAGGIPFDVASGHLLIAGIEAQLHDATRVLEHAQAAAAVATEHDSPVLVSSAAQLRGWAMAALGDAAGGLTVLSQGETAWRASGQRLGLPSFAVLRAEVCLWAGDCGAAEMAIGAGLAHAQATGEHRRTSDLHRLRAECLRRTGRMGEAAAALDTALDIATQQGARLAELRAAIDRVRIDRSTSSRARTASRLASVARSFDNGALPELSVAAGLLRIRSAGARNRRNRWSHLRQADSPRAGRHG